MPTDTVRITRVHSMATKNPHITQHFVEGYDQRGLTQQYQTANDWRGSFCKRHELNPVWVTVVWKDSRFGKEIVGVGEAQTA